MLDPHQNDHRSRNNPEPAFDISALNWEETRNCGEIEVEITTNLEDPRLYRIARDLYAAPPADPDSENDNIVTLRALTYLDYEQPEPHADILVSAGRRHFCSTSSRDWPVLDALFGRMAWKKFANNYAAENASDWDFDEE